jgi:hypothetical protein
VSHKIIAEVSRFLRDTLFDGFSDDPEIAGVIPTATSIALSNPAEDITSARQASLWLYQVVPNEHLRNAPMIRQGDADSQYPPLAVNLYYLFTPSTDDDHTNQLVLGKTLQVFHDNSILRMESQDVPGTAEELHLTLVQRTIEELAEVWEALQEPYRLSVCYEVRIVRIASRRVIASKRILERASDFVEAMS